MANSLALDTSRRSSRSQNGRLNVAASCPTDQFRVDRLGIPYTMPVFRALSEFPEFRCSPGSAAFFFEEDRTASSARQRSVGCWKRRLSVRLCNALNSPVTLSEKR